MSENLEENKNTSKNTVSKRIGSIFRYFIASALLLFSLGMLTIYHLFNLQAGSAWPVYSGKISNVQDIRSLYIHGSQASANMNLFEIFLWTLVPALLVFLSLAIFRPEKIKKTTLISLGLVFVLLLLAFGSNKLGANLLEKQLLQNNLEKGSQIFELVEYPGVNLYYYSDANDFENGKTIQMEFWVLDSLENVRNSYLTKGFVKPSSAGNDLELEKEKVYLYFGNKTDYLKTEGDGTSVRVYCGHTCISF